MKRLILQLRLMMLDVRFWFLKREAKRIDNRIDEMMAQKSLFSPECQKEAINWIRMSESATLEAREILIQRMKLKLQLQTLGNHNTIVKIVPRSSDDPRAAQSTSDADTSPH